MLESHELPTRLDSQLSNSRTVAVYVVTYRRPALLRRALASLIAQTHKDFVATVLNDDPGDSSVAKLVSELGDPRIRLSLPSKRRGGAGNFNVAFREVHCSYASILEDDNWWEPEFLEHMLAALSIHPTIQVASGNERFWREQQDGTWANLKACLWDDHSDRIYRSTFRSACGSQTIGNSALLFRTGLAAAWLTPDDIPVDVTEHFRERVIAQPILLVGRPLVNFSVTLVSHRDSSGMIWSVYQVLLIGSMFCVTPSSFRAMRARELWDSMIDKAGPQATSYLLTAVAIPEARDLWRRAPLRARLRFLFSAIRHPIGLLVAIRARNKYPDHWEFLVRSSIALNFPDIDER